MDALEKRAKQIALQLIIRSRILFQPHLYRAFASPITLEDDHDPARLETAGRMLEGVLSYLPEEIRQGMRVDENFAALPLEPISGVTISPLRAQDGELWYLFSAVSPFTDAEGFSDEMVNEINQRLILSGFIYSKDATGVVSGITIRESEVGPTFISLCATLTQDHYAQMLRIVAEREEMDEQRRSILETQGAADLFQSNQVRPWVTRDIEVGYRQYLERLETHGADDLVLGSEREDGVTLRFPLPGFSGEVISSVLDLSLDEEPIGALTFTSFLPHRLEKREALALAGKLNKGDQDLTIHTTPMTTGVWTAEEGEDSLYYLRYLGVLPVKYRHLVPLVDHIEGAVREVVASWDRLKLFLAFDQITKKGS